MSDLQRQLVGQDPELRPFAEANGPARSERDPQLESLRGMISEIVKRQRHQRQKVSGLRKTMGDGSTKAEDVPREVVV
jgi:hypothetical protein